MRVRRPGRRPRGDARGHGPVRADVGRARGRDGACAHRIILSAKVSAVQDLIAVYAELRGALRLRPPPRPHRSRQGSKGIVASSAAWGFLLQQGIGDTDPRLAHARARRRRTVEVKVGPGVVADHGISHLVSAGGGLSGLRPHDLHHVQELARDIQAFIRDSMPEWKSRYAGVEALNVAVMGCIVNGPGESKHADIGISLPGTGEQPAAPVFVDGKKGGDTARCDRGGRLQEDGDRLYRAALQPWRGRADGGRIALKWRSPRCSP